MNENRHTGTESNREYFSPNLNIHSLCGAFNKNLPDSKMEYKFY